MASFPTKIVPTADYEEKHSSFFFNLKNRSTFYSQQYLHSLFCTYSVGQVKIIIVVVRMNEFLLLCCKNTDFQLLPEYDRKMTNPSKIGEKKIFLV